MRKLEIEEIRELIDPAQLEDGNHSFTIEDGKVTEYSFESNHPDTIAIRKDRQLRRQRSLKFKKIVEEHFNASHK